MEHVFFELPTEQATQHVGEKLSMCLCAPLVLAFQGDLGAGKTTLIRAMLRALHVEGRIKSPTFSLVESYDIPQKNMLVHHFDLYRISDEYELDYIGFRDYFSRQTVCCIEWAERSKNLTALVDIRATLTVSDDMQRSLQLTAMTPAGSTFLSCLEHYA